ncbi:hypothetical protein [Herbiconiux sp. VKM Ac-2851]|uniref:hypothetical protein n=1 Tax=Herbiconiux sp. VKM Ac-2851 TaxID=2739025 RepID=UPI001566F7E9|nr:hypothetical protein [Herbiconiux sp. VKM Ac-2851]NQX33918.1 hypothetical protein [Herbiconiux sp. VKM Ac-2851]
MEARRRFKPLWRWEALLFAVVLVAAMAASLVARPSLPVVGPIASVLLLAIAVAAALALIVPLLRKKGHDSENSRHDLGGVELVPFPGLGEVPVTTRVVESERRQTAIEAALAKSRAVQAVLTPDASRWLGRELRVAVDLVDDAGAAHRVGFVPRDVDARVDEALRTVTADSGRAATVPVTVVGAERPRRVEIVL